MRHVLFMMPICHTIVAVYVYLISGGRVSSDQSEDET